MSAPRGRPARTPEGVEAMRGKVTAAAARLFREEGYASVSMRRLAKEAGCTPMTLYAYFGSKTDILRHIWAEVFEALFAELEALGKTIPDPAARLAALSRRYVRYWVDNPETYRVVFMTEGVTQPEVSVFVDASETVSRFQLFFETMREALGGADEAKLRTRTEVLLCGLQGIAHSLITVSAYPWASAETLADEIAAALTR